MADLSYEVSFKGVASPTLRAAFMDCEQGTGVGTTWVRCTHGPSGRSSPGSRSSASNYSTSG
jgi:hypothetical protein